MTRLPPVPLRPRDPHPRVTHDHLRLLDMIWANEALTAGRALDRAWGERALPVDPCAQLDRLYGGVPEGAIESRDFLPPLLDPRDSDEPFVLLRTDHVEALLAALHRCRDADGVTTDDDLATLEAWRGLSRSPHRHCVAYFPSRPLPPAPPAAAPTPEPVAAPPARDDGDRRGAFPSERLDVRASRVPLVMSALLALLVVPAGVLLLVNGQTTGLLIGAANLLIFGVVIWLVRRGHVRSVRAFTPEGAVLTDGRRLAWADLSHVDYQVRHNAARGTRGIWRIELHFTTGEVAWLIPAKVRNFAEVALLVAALPCAHREVWV